LAEEVNKQMKKFRTAHISGGRGHNFTSIYVLQPTSIGHCAAKAENGSRRKAKMK
jgi:hypothetical protein